MLVQALSALAMAVLVQRLLKFISVTKDFAGFAQLWCPFEPLSLPGAISPSTWWNPGLKMPWIKRSRWYAEYNSETIAILPWFHGLPSIYTSSPEVMRQVLGPGSTMPKPMRLTESLLLFGPNVIASEGEDWRRHRKISAPAFAQKTYDAVWDETARIYKDIMREPDWATSDQVQSSSFGEYTTKLALFVISAIGFGIHLNWSDQSAQKLAIQENMIGVANNLIARQSLPSWVYWLPIEGLRAIDRYFTGFARMMDHEVSVRRKEMREQLAVDPSHTESLHADVFGRLVMANELSGGTLLSDADLIGNSFGFLFAGHETTAHTLSVTLAMLALEQKEQDAAYACIQSVLDHNRDPTPQDYSALEPVLWCFYEALRLFPTAYVTIRETMDDTVLDFPDPTDSAKLTPLCVPKGTMVVLDVVGTNYNPRYFPDPLTFRPSRFGGADPAPVLTFSIGPRACLGRRFATTEAVCFLTYILRDWKVDLVLNAGETPAQWKTRVLSDPVVQTTLKFDNVPLRFTRRR